MHDDRDLEEYAEVMANALQRALYNDWVPVAIRDDWDAVEYKKEELAEYVVKIKNNILANKDPKGEMDEETYRSKLLQDMDA